MSKRIKYLVTAALFAALVTVCTKFTSIPLFGGVGYVHVGDTFVYLAAAFLPMPYPIFAAAIGGLLADILSGYAVYALPTAIIKGLMALAIATQKKYVGLISAWVILVAGYYITELIIYRSFVVPLPGLLWNSVQALVSSVCFLFLYTAIKPHIKK